MAKSFFINSGHKTFKVRYLSSGDKLLSLNKNKRIPTDELCSRHGCKLQVLILLETFLNKLVCSLCIFRIFFISEIFFHHKILVDINIYILLKQSNIKIPSIKIQVNNYQNNTPPFSFKIFYIFFSIKIL